MSSSQEDLAAQVETLVRRVEALERQLEQLRQAQAQDDHETTQDRFNIAIRLGTMIDRAMQLINAQAAEISRLRVDVTVLTGNQATPGQLLDLYELRRADRPRLTLKQFLVELGALSRYRTVVNERHRRRKQGDAPEH